AVAGDDVEEQHGEALRERWEEEYDRLLPEIVLLPGARDLVLLLADQGVRVALASSGKARFTDHVVGLLDLPEGTLAGTTSSDDAEHSKPEPDILSSALEAAGGSSAVVVGDTTYDVTAAARMGAPCVGLLSGGFGRVELEDAGAVHVAGTPAELLEADWDGLLEAEPAPAAREDRTPLDRSAGWPGRGRPAARETPLPAGSQTTPSDEEDDGSMSASTQEPEATLLVVEDETNIRELLTTSLRFAGFAVHAAPDGRTALQLASEHEIDLAVLDIMLPDMDGFTVTRNLRDRGLDLPIVFLTARDSLDDKVKGLTVGGDDYVTKPFSLEEVVARIRAVLRRTRVAEEEADDHVLRVADLELDEDSHEVRRAGQVIEVSPTEFKLLRYLMLNPGRVLSKSQILDHVWDYDFRGEMNIVESYISYLRRKIDVVGE